MTTTVKSTPKSRIIALQNLIGANPDGSIGRQTVELLAKHKGVSKIAAAMFLGQCHAETDGFKVATESLHYTTEARLLEIFGKGRHSAAILPSETKNYLRNARALAERVYGVQNPKQSQWLGNVNVGDGFAYIGRAALQLTGRGWYQRVSDKLGVNFVANPELAASDKYYFQVALAEFDLGNYWRHANDTTDAGIRQLSVTVNGGTNGLDKRMTWTKFYLKFT